MMSLIRTFIFIDLESTGIPTQSRYKVRITELCMIAVSRRHILKCPKGKYLPRVLSKLLLPMNPRSPIDDEIFEKTGLDNDLLEDVTSFDIFKANILKNFMETLEAPICMVAHNGSRFDFPLLKEEIKRFPEIISDSVLVVDSLKAFRDLISKNTTELLPCTTKTDIELVEVSDLVLSQIPNIQSINETTPMAEVINSSPDIARVKRKLFAENSPSQSKNSKLSFKLEDIYKSLFDTSIDSAHCAESDVLALLKCCVKMGDPIIEYFDKNCNNFGDVISMYH